MSFDSDFKSAASEVVSAFGVASIYTQDSTPIDVPVHIEKEAEAVDEFGTLAIIGRAAYVSLDALGVSPKPNDTIAQGGRTYTVQKVVENDGYFATLAIT